jgi:hypothetical protein
LVDRSRAKDRSWTWAAVLTGFALAWLTPPGSGVAGAATHSGPKPFRSAKTRDLRWSDRPAPQIRWTDGQSATRHRGGKDNAAGEDDADVARPRRIDTTQLEIDLLQPPEPAIQRPKLQPQPRPQVQPQAHRPAQALAESQFPPDAPSDDTTDIAAPADEPFAPLDDSTSVLDTESDDATSNSLVPQEPDAEMELMPSPDYLDQQGDRPPSSVTPQQECQRVLDMVQANRISSIGLNIRVTGEPGRDIPFECEVGGDQPYQARDWPETIFTWKASGVCHKPLYFEEEALERYGHEKGPLIQPVYSGARFFATLPILPYKMGLTPPTECIYALGYYRPGSCAPYMIEPLPLSLRAALFEAAAVVGAAAVLP